LATAVAIDIAIDINLADRRMTPLPLAAVTLTNACGVGLDEIRRALRTGSSGLRQNDFEPARGLDTWIGRVDGLESEALAPDCVAHDCRNNRLARLSLDQDGFVAAVDAARSRYGEGRVGVFIGTTTSGILSTELAYRSGSLAPDGPSRPEDEPSAGLSPELYRYKHSMYATTMFVRSYLSLSGYAMTISTACSSSAKVFAAAARAIDAGLCDAAVVGGVDSLALSTLFGFHSLELLSRRPCRPFASDRDGISIGEGAGFALLDPQAESPVRLLGAGESADAYHMSSPHPEGAGAAAAMRKALSGAGLVGRDIDYINLHGTASRANDLAEDRGVVSAVGKEPAASSTKGWTGHLLGAAGITEAVISALSLIDQWIPGTLNCERVDPALHSNLLVDSQTMRLRHVMSNSFGFGGSNCSLVFGLGQ
jgi:3-oxoacyl-[acyl-carrier-protein] synthase-1